MSYKSIVLSDNPVAYWKLDDYDGIAEDSSPCNNDGTFNGIQSNGLIPLVCGNVQATKITNSVSVDFTTLNDYSTHQMYQTFGTSDSLLNPFTLECWIYQHITHTSAVPIFADTTNNVGLFYENGNITFSLDTDSLTYTLPYLNKALHIVATYSGYYAVIYINGVAVAAKTMASNLFEGTELNLSAGPTSYSSDYFLANSFSVYRYALSGDQIKRHYDSAYPVDPKQIVEVDKGSLFYLYDNGISAKFVYTYPLNKTWRSFTTDENIYFNQDTNSIEVLGGTGDPKTVEINDFIFIPSGLTIDDSIIEWEGTNGITVETSVDGITYTQCTNNRSIPQYSIDGGINPSMGLYIKITMYTSDDSKYIPVLSYLTVAFYKSQVMYSQTSTDYFSQVTDISGVNSEANLGNIGYPILSRDDRNGVRVASDAGFYINTDKEISSVEFFYTPSSFLASGLIATTDEDGGAISEFKWASNGDISKTNIAAIHVNGVDKTLTTNSSSLFVANNLYHVVVAFTSPVIGKIGFNYSDAGSVEALYQNIGIYDYDISDLALSHYNLYTQGSLTSIQDTSMSVTESGFTAYNIDWKVIESQ